MTFQEVRNMKQLDMDTDITETQIKISTLINIDTDINIAMSNNIGIVTNINENIHIDHTHRDKRKD